MSNIANKYKVGIFVAIGLLLIVISLLLLGALEYFAPKYKAYTVVNQSVQGLEPGAKVKYSGVTIGKVTDVSIGFKQKDIYIYMEFPMKRMDPVYKNLSPGEYRKKLTEDFASYIKGGLRGRLALEGITGSLYIELKFYDPQQFPAASGTEYHPFGEDMLYVPSIPMVEIASIIENIEKAVNKLANLNYDQTLSDLNKVLASTNRMLNDEDLKSSLKDIKVTAAELKSIVEKINKSITESKMNDTVKNLNQTLDRIGSLADFMKTEVQKSDIPQTTGTARNFMNSSEYKFTVLRNDLLTASKRLEDTLNAFKMLALYLEQNPSSLISGKQGQPVVKP
ncbi:MAG: MlaD family protein [Victivallaceae bacterium]|jgi:ABC-type transporter Mla subunit MlaD